MDQDWYKNVEYENEYDECSTEENYNKKNKLVIIEENIHNLYFEIRDYLRDVHEIDLLHHMDSNDVAMLLYNQEYIKKCQQENE